MSTWQKQLANLRHKQQLMYILVFSLATVVVWITVNLITSQRKTEIPKELIELAKPLTPTINRQVLNELQAKRAYAASELTTFPIYKIITDRSGSSSKVTIDTPEPERGLTVRNGQAVVTSPVPSPSPGPATPAEVTPSATPAATTSATPTPNPGDSV